MDIAIHPLRVLMVEDSTADAELVLRALRRLSQPFKHVRVADEGGLRAALAGFVPDVILSDFSMPGFSGQEALAIAREVTPQVPFLFVSDTIGEEVAMDALRRGAMDYVLKDNLMRLAPAIERAIDVARQRSERVHIESALRESEERFRTIVESSRDWIWENECDTRITYSNGAIAHILGYTLEEMHGKLATDHMLPRDREQVRLRVPQAIAERIGWERWRLRWRHRDGSVRVLESTATPRFDAGGALTRTSPSNCNRKPASATSCASTRCSARLAMRCCVRARATSCCGRCARSRWRRAISRLPASACRPIPTGWKPSQAMATRLSSQ